jgi:lantibiotic modifying enzyme
MTDSTGLIADITQVVDHYHLKHREELPISLFGGKAGLAVYYYYLSEYLGKKEMAAESIRLLESIGEELDAGIRLVPKVMHSYANGIAGVGFTFTHFYNRGFLPFDHREAFGELDNFLLNGASKDCADQCADFLHGPMGILYYYLNEPYGERTKALTEKLFDMFLGIAIIDEKGLRVRNTIVEQEFDEFDLCLAHGLSGYLLILQKLARNAHRTDKIRETMYLMLNYIQAAEQKDFSVHGGNSCFPTSINELYPRDHALNLKNYTSRLAWCYGDLGIAYSMIRCGEFLGDDKMVATGLETALLTTQLTDGPAAGVKDVFFCHGSAGASYMYKKLFRNTGEKAFDNASRLWRKFTIGHYGEMAQYFGKNYSLNLLEGLPAVALAMMESDDDSIFEWDHFFLLQ